MTAQEFIENKFPIVKDRLDQDILHRVNGKELIELIEEFVDKTALVKAEDIIDSFTYQSENSDYIYKKDDFIKIAKGNVQYAQSLMERVEWQAPETLVDEDLRDGEIIEFNGQYIMTKGMNIEVKIND